MTAPISSGDRRPRSAVGRSRRHVVVLVAVAVVATAGIVLLAAGVAGVGSPRSAAPVVATDARAPITMPVVATPGASPAVLPDHGPAARASSSAPHWIDIPAISVRSVVNAGGLNPDGTLEVPRPGPHYDQASWYTGSVTPGVPGPSVILGHIDSAANGPSVFYRLAALRPLDEFTVTRDDGTVLTYRVNSVKQYPKNAFPTQEVYGPTTRPEMRLITCGGSFDDRARSYRDNTVVYANQISG